MPTVPTSRCPKCEGSMVEGAIVDMGYGQASVAKWQEGPITVSRWFGLKLRKKAQLPTVAMRCTRCGLVEVYALPLDD